MSTHADYNGYKPFSWNNLLALTVLGDYEARVKAYKNIDNQTSGPMGMLSVALNRDADGWPTYDALKDFQYNLSELVDLNLWKDAYALMSTLPQLEKDALHDERLERNDERQGIREAKEWAATVSVDRHNGTRI